MVVENREAELLVFVYGGTGRSGKKSIVESIAANKDRTATEETGADYRTVTKVLLDEGHIAAEMSEHEIEGQIIKIGSAAITDIVAARKDIEKLHGHDSLHTPLIDEVVPKVAAVPFVREPVKEGFRQRVKTVKDSGAYDFLLIDGRVLGPVIGDLPGIQLMMRTFVTCEPAEAALREIERNKLSMATEKGRLEYKKQLEAIERRNFLDATRQIDPVKPEAGAINYWENQDEIGYIAARQNHEIFFDTTPFREFDEPKRSMEMAALHMFDEYLVAQNLAVV